MVGITHRVAGLSVGVLLGSRLIAEPYTPEQLIMAGSFIAASTLGSLFPDIDKKNTLISKKMKVTSTIISKLTEHRGATHAPLIYIFILGLLYILTSIYLGSNIFVCTLFRTIIVGFFVGVVSHLLLDMMTIQGIPILYPFISVKNKFHLLPLKTGKCERFIRILIIVFTIGGMVYWK